ncbi:MAG: hypothetical protein FIB08_14320 [Candidatus Methanoperedens sp.]|nr:hypothetical protein [Candidatus Methanoperedens sp.]
MTLTGNYSYEFIDTMITIVENIKRDMMKQRKGSRSEPHRMYIKGITEGYVILAKKVLEKIFAEQVIIYIYSEFEKPVTEHLGFPMQETNPYL